MWQTKHVILVICLALILLFLVSCDKPKKTVSGEHFNYEAPEKLDILFFATSLVTAFIDIPGIFAELARQGGHSVHVDVSKDGSLNEHLNSTISMSMITQKQWDFIVLTEHTLIVPSEERRLQEMYPAARILDSLIQDIGAKTIFYLQCAYRDGYTDTEIGVELNGYESMQDLIVEGYLGIADELDAMVAPVGVACNNTRGKFDLWWQDGVHPNMESAYLAACVLFATLYQESPEGILFRGAIENEPGAFGLQTTNLDDSTATFLQAIAAETVLEDLERWNIQ